MHCVKRNLGIVRLRLRRVFILKFVNICILSAQDLLEGPAVAFSWLEYAFAGLALVLLGLMGMVLLTVVVLVSLTDTQRRPSESSRVALHNRPGLRECVSADVHRKRPRPRSRLAGNHVQTDGAVVQCSRIGQSSGVKDCFS